MINIKEVQELLSTTCPYEPEEITLDKDLFADLELDSFGLMEMVINFENMYGISIPDTDLPSLVTVKDIVDYLEIKTSKDGTPLVQTV